MMPPHPPHQGCADEAPTEPSLTAYDEKHLITYLQLLDAVADDADWRDVTQIVLRIDPNADAHRARRAYDSHLDRAVWMSSYGFRLLPRNAE